MKTVNVTEVPQGAQLIDVREPDEFATAHAAGAVNLPLSNFVGLADKIDPNQDIYVICKSGGRSAHAAEYLDCLLYTSPSPRDQRGSRMPSSA